MRVRESKNTAINEAARTQRANVETRKIVDAVTRQMGYMPDPLGAAEDGLCNILNGHGYKKALSDLQVLEERLLFHGPTVPDAPMMERIHFLHVLINCMKDLVDAEAEKSVQLAPVREN